MAAKVDIFNEALALLGANQISDPDGAGIAATINSVYDSCRLSLIESHPWNFAIKRASLGQQVTTPEFQYAYQYTLPADCIRILKFYELSDDWAEEDGMILTDSSGVSAIYVADITDVNAMTALFRKTLAYDIASTVGYTITQNQGLVEHLVARRQQIFVQAKLIDGQKTNPILNAFTSNTVRASQIQYGDLDD